MTKKIVQHSAKESQKHHVELIESSKEIDELKISISQIIGPAVNPIIHNLRFVVFKNFCNALIEV